MDVDSGQLLNHNGEEFVYSTTLPLSSLFSIVTTNIEPRWDYYSMEERKWITWGMPNE